MASAAIVDVQFSDDSQTYTVEVRRNNGTVIATITPAYPIGFDPGVVRDQIAAAAQDVVERSRAKNQRRQLAVGTVIDLG